MGGTGQAGFQLQPRHSLTKDTADRDQDGRTDLDSDGIYILESAEEADQVQPEEKEKVPPWKLRVRWARTMAEICIWC